MKRGETLWLSPEQLSLLGLPEDASMEEQRAAMDVQCHHETDPFCNDYLFKMQGDSQGLWFFYANPDGERRRMDDHICWRPKARAQYLAMNFLSGGHEPGSPEYHIYAVRSYHKERLTFLHRWHKMTEGKLKEKENVDQQQMHLRLVKP